MTGHIDRQTAIDALEEQIKQCDKAIGSFGISMKDEYAVKVEKASLMAFKETLENIPDADVVPVVHSRWVLGGYDDMYYVCERCRHKQSEYYAKPTANFCPNCGADMRGGNDATD